MLLSTGCGASQFKAEQLDIVLLQPLDEEPLYNRAIHRPPILEAVLKRRKMCMILAPLTRKSRARKQKKNNGRRSKQVGGILHAIGNHRGK